MIALDCETTGVDFHHGCKPFLVVTCDENGEQRAWEWDVDPLTRDVRVDENDIKEIGDLLAEHDWKVLFHNAKFDMSAMASVGMWDLYDCDSVWENVEDTLLASHLLHSNLPKDLTSLSLRWLDADIEPLEMALKRCVQEVRHIIQHTRQREKRFGEELDVLAQWRIAEEGDAMIPSAKTKKTKDGVKEGPWRCDYWLPRAYAKHMWETTGHPEWNPEARNVHEYWTVTRDYALHDPSATLAIYRSMMEEIRVDSNLLTIYRERLKILPITYRMEQRGVTLSGNRLNELLSVYAEESKDAGELCLGIASEYKIPCPRCSTGKKLFECQLCRGTLSAPFQLSLPKGASPNNSIKEFMYEHLKLPRISGKKSKTGNASLDGEVINEYLLTCGKGTPELLFLKTWQFKKKRDTCSGYMEGYKKFWRPWIPAWEGAVDPKTGAGWYVLHPNLNPTGTDTLRFSSSNPNSQNISRQSSECEECDGEGCKKCRYTGKSLRSLKYTFGPVPGREWYSFDAQGIEDRLPAYESEQQELIDIFERPKDPPYYGSNHYLRFHTVYPEIWEKELPFQMKNKEHIKKKYKSTYYGWCKNGGFAVQYGAIEKSDGWGTADRAFHKQFSHRMLKERFDKLEELNQKCIWHANKYGYVETIPDRSLGLTRGYPLSCTRTEYGRILETVPLNYHIQGSAMWWTMKATIRVDGFFRSLNDGSKFAGKTWPGGYYICLQVHDELVTDMPRGKDKDYNLPIVREVQRLMAMGGDDYGIPTPVGAEYHENNWEEGVTL